MKKQQGNGTDFEAYLSYAEENYTSRVNAKDLLSLESGLLENLHKVQESLSSKYTQMGVLSKCSIEDTRTVREVLYDGEQRNGR